MNSTKTILLPIALLTALASCNNDEQGPAGAADTLKDSRISLPVRPEAGVDSTFFFERDSLILVLSKKVLKALKNEDFRGLADFADPEHGIRISADAHIDSLDRVLTPQQLMNSNFTNSMINWGADEQTGVRIQMTLADYVKKYIYPVDFLSAPKVGVNKSIGVGTTLNNLKEFYRGAAFIEFHFPGFEKKFEGMDWKSIRLVFRSNGEKLSLIGIIRDHWTT